MARFNKMHSNRIRAEPRKRSASFDRVLSLEIPVTRDGTRQFVSAEKAFLLKLRDQSRRGDVSASEMLAEYDDVSLEILNSDGPGRIKAIRTIIWDPGSVTLQLQSLRMAKKFDRYSKQAQMKLEPWIVEAALARLGERRLSHDEQRTVYAATRTPHKVRWPDWWQPQE